MDTDYIIIDTHLNQCIFEMLEYLIKFCPPHPISSWLPDRKLERFYNIFFFTKEILLS